MSRSNWAVRSLLTALLAAGSLALPTAVAQQDPTPAADNTRANKDHGKTADQQKDNKADLAITRQIRKAIVADKSLSTYAHNVKVITTNGTVTLRGPVRTEEEKASIESKAKAIAGVSDVVNEITVAPKGA